MSTKKVTATQLDLSRFDSFQIKRLADTECFECLWDNSEQTGMEGVRYYRFCDIWLSVHSVNPVGRYGRERGRWLREYEFDTAKAEAIRVKESTDARD